MTPDPPPPPSDDPPPFRLVRAALADRELLEELSAHALVVLGRLRPDRAATRKDEADDVVQETCRRALRRCNTFNPRAGSVDAWLHGILNNVLREHLRDLQNLPAQFQETREPDAVSLAPLHRARDDANQTVEDLIRRAPPEHREILLLRFVERLDHAEIAARLGISLGCARVRLSRDLAALRRELGNDPREDRQ
jgi:RNA polymerase sigma-70 factor (ECF subfamily)